MSDSCKPRKLEPGFAATYSKPRDLITSTMKSEPVRSAVRTLTSVAGSPSFGGIGGTVAERATNDCCAPATPVLATSVATPPTAAPFRNLRRPTKLLADFFMAGISLLKLNCAEAPGTRRSCACWGIVHARGPYRGFPKLAAL